MGTSPTHTLMRFPHPLRKGCGMSCHRNLREGRKNAYLKPCCLILAPQGCSQTLGAECFTGCWCWPDPLKGIPVGLIAWEGKSQCCGPQCGWAEQPLMMGHGATTPHGQAPTGVCKPGAFSLTCSRALFWSTVWLVEASSTSCKSTLLRHAKYSSVH